MFASDIERDIQRRYPTIHIRWNAERKRFEIWEKHGKMHICRGWRKLWDYENPDGSHYPIHYNQVLEWLQRADVRLHPQRDLFREIVLAKEERSNAAKKKVADAIYDSIIDDWRYMAGHKSFFMDPKSMPQWVSTMRPSQAQMFDQLKRAGMVK